MRKYFKTFSSILVCITLAFICYGCNNGTSVDKKIDQLKQFIIQEDYGFATKVYIDNHDNSGFLEGAEIIIKDVAKKITDNMNNDNLPTAKAFVDFLGSIDNSIIKEEVLGKISEIEKSIIDNSDAINEIDTTVTEESNAITSNEENEYVPKLDVINDYGDFNYKSYCNSRFGYSIEYPSFLVNEMGSQNNSGVVLSNDDNSVKLSLWADNNALFLTLQEVYDNALKESINVTYSSLGSRSYVISGEEGDYVYYKNQVVGEGSMNGFMIKYPKRDEEFFDDIVTKLYNTFNAPNVDQCW